MTIEMLTYRPRRGSILLRTLATDNGNKNKPLILLFVTVIMTQSADGVLG